jgi:predicted metal-dependent HD superfamily phosphohydrolase
MKKNLIEIKKYFHVKLLTEIFFQTMMPLLKNEKDVEKLLDDVIVRYSVKSRFYHDLHHIQGMCSLLEYNAEIILDYSSVFLAIIYHDIIYNVKRNDNEEKSAEYFRKKIAPLLNLPKHKIEKVCLYIMATKHNLTAENLKRVDCDVKLFLDFDLETLGYCNEENYKIYSDNIRKEYKIYSNEQYCVGRKMFLKKFLAKKDIYLTKEFKILEKNARKNLQNEINSYIC